MLWKFIVPSDGAHCSTVPLIVNNIIHHFANRNGPHTLQINGHSVKCHRTLIEHICSKLAYFKSVTVLFQKQSIDASEKETVLFVTAAHVEPEHECNQALV